MKTLAILGFLGIAASGGNLIEVTAVSEVAVPESAKMTYTVGEHAEVMNIVKPSLITTEDVAEVSIGQDPMVVSVKLSADGGKKFTAGTTGMAGKRIAIIVQGRIVSAPIINTAPLGGLFEVSGFKDAAEAKAFADAFKKARG